MQLGIGFLGVALAFGLTVLTMAYAVGHVSGAHSPAGYSMTAVLIAEALLTAEPALDAPREHIGSVFGIRPGKRLSPQLRVQFLQHGRLLLCSA